MTDPSNPNVPFGDDYGDMTTTIGPFLAELREFGQGPAPEPSPELEALLSGATPIRGRARRPSGRRVLITSAAAAVVISGGAGIAAANDSLPQPAQRYVARLVNDLTPFHIELSRVPGPGAHPSPAGSPSAPRNSSDGSDSPAPGSPADSGQPGSGGAAGDGPSNEPTQSETAARSRSGDGSGDAPSGSPRHTGASTGDGSEFGNPRPSGSPPATPTTSAAPNRNSAG